MKRKLFTLGISLLLMGNCAVNNVAAAEEINCEFSYFNYVIPAEDGYYLLCDNLAAYWDGEIGHQAVPLCSDLGCAHNSEDCPAFVYTLWPKMYYVNDSLYTFGIGEYNEVTKSGAYPFWKIAKDGSSKEVAFKVEQYPQQFTVFQDFVYYESTVEDENGKQISSIYRNSLDGDDEKLIWTSQLQQSDIYILQGIGDLLYFQEAGFARDIDLKDPQLDFTQLHQEYNLFTYNPKTEALETNPMDSPEDGKFVNIRNIYEGNIYYAREKEERAMYLWRKSADNLGEPEFLGAMPKYPGLADDQYMYTYFRINSEQGTCGLNIYDYEGNLKQEIVLQDMISSMELIPANEEYIFGYMTRQAPDEAKIECTILLLEREKLADGTAELLPLITN